MFNVNLLCYRYKFEGLFCGSLNQEEELFLMTGRESLPCKPFLILPVPGRSSSLAGSIAAEAERAAFPSQHTMNNSTTHWSGALSAASGSSSQDDGSSSDDEGYSDDGYGDGSRAPHGGVQYRSRSSLHADGHARDGKDASDSDKSGDGSWQDGADEVRFSGQAGEGAGAAAARKLRAADSGVASFAVSLEGLRLDGVAVAEVIRAQFEVRP